MSGETAQGKKKNVSVARTPDPGNMMLLLYTFAALLCILLGGVLKADGTVAPVDGEIDSAGNGRVERLSVDLK